MRDSFHTHTPKLFFFARQKSLLHDFKGKFSPSIDAHAKIQLHHQGKLSLLNIKDNTFPLEPNGGCYPVDDIMPYHLQFPSFEFLRAITPNIKKFLCPLRWSMGGIFIATFLDQEGGKRCIYLEANIYWIFCQTATYWNMSACVWLWGKVYDIYKEAPFIFQCSMRCYVISQTEKGLSWKKECAAAL